MTELIINEIFNTFPFFILAYMPVRDKMRYSAKSSLLVMFVCETVYICLYALLIEAGLHGVSAQYLAVPVFIGLMMFLVKADVGIICFIFIFTVDYLLVIRAATFCVCSIFGFGFFSLQAGIITFLLTIATVFIMSHFLTGIVNRLLSVQVPDFRRTIWLLPFFATMTVMVLTGRIRDGSYSNTALIARILLLICMFLISHLMIMFINKLQEQIIANARIRTMENLLGIQREQYEMLQARINENRRARHDFRQHRAVIRDMVNRGDLTALRNYLDEYDRQSADISDRTYCANPTVNAVLAFYADNAEKDGIRFTASIKMPDKPVIQETEFCVLLGNLLENALDAGRADIAAGQSPDSTFIRVLIIQNGMSNLSVAVDNSCLVSPVWGEGRLMSGKHPGSGIGTESIRYIADKYDGEARFEWRDKVFYSSVMLNPQ